MTHIRTLSAWAQALAYLTRETPVRLSVAQLTVFALAALGDRMGSPVNLSQVQEALEGAPGGSIHTTYTVFFDVHKGERHLGWLWQDRCYEDQRVKWLRLTPKGAAILDGMMAHLERSTAASAGACGLPAAGEKGPRVGSSN